MEELRQTLDARYLEAMVAHLAKLVAALDAPTLKIGGRKLGLWKGGALRLRNRVESALLEQYCCYCIRVEKNTPAEALAEAVETEGENLSDRVQAAFGDARIALVRVDLPATKSGGGRPVVFDILAGETYELIVEKATETFLKGPAGAVTYHAVIVLPIEENLCLAASTPITLHRNQMLTLLRRVRRRFPEGFDIHQSTRQQRHDVAAIFFRGAFEFDVALPRQGA